MGRGSEELPGGALLLWRLAVFSLGKLRARAYLCGGSRVKSMTLALRYIYKEKIFYG